MKKRIMLILVLLFLIIFISPEAKGAEPTNKELLEEIRVLSKKVAELEKRLSEQEVKQAEVGKVLHGAKRGEEEYKDPSITERLKQQETKTIEIEKVLHGAKRAEFEYKPGEGLAVAGLVIAADATFVLQGTPNANNAGAGEDSIFNASWSSDIEIEKAFSDWGLAFLHLEPGIGDTIESELSVFSNVNRDASPTDAIPEVTEVWYEHYFFNKQVAIGGGKLDFTVYFDQNQYANDETTQFLAHMFRNSPVIEFPSDNTLGFHTHICMEAARFLEFDFGYFNANVTWKNIFDHSFYMGQVNVIPVELLNYVNKDQWGGNYRFYVWINDRFHEKLANEVGALSDNTKEMNYGFGMSFDQMATDVFGLFARFGWQRPDIIPAGAQRGDSHGDPTLEWSWSTGVQMTGKYYKRPDDTFGFAIGQVFPSIEWKDAASDNYGAGEGHIELYYKCQLNKCLAISPDFQFIWNPRGVNHSWQGDNDMIFVYGARAQVDF